MSAVLLGWFAAIFFFMFIVAALFAFIRRSKIKQNLKEQNLPNFNTIFVTSFSDMSTEKVFNEIAFFIGGNWDDVQSKSLVNELKSHRLLEWFYIVSYLLAMVSFLAYIFFSEV